MIGLRSAGQLTELFMEDANVALLNGTALENEELFQERMHRIFTTSNQAMASLSTKSLNPVLMSRLPTI